MSSCQNKSPQQGSSFGIFDQDKAQLLVIRITEEPMLLTE